MMSLTSEIPLLLSILFSLTSALPTPQSGDGGGGTPPTGGLGYDPSALGSTNGGSSGTDNGYQLSTGATVAIAVVAGFVVIAGIVTMTLFYLSKKKQWNLRDKARGSLRRVGTGLREVMTPRTPHKMTFSPVLKQRSGSDGAQLLKSQTRAPSSSPKRGRDLEKALPDPSSKTYTATVSGPLPTESHSRGPSEHRATSHTRGLSLNTNVSKDGKTGQKIKEKKPAPASMMVPQSKFDMDSPKTPFLSRFVFGRR